MVLDNLKNLFSEYEIKDEKNGFTFKKVIAERKAFLSTKKLEYSGKVKIDEEKKEIVFSEMLKESGSGFTGGGDMDSGFGFSSGTYSSGMNGRSGTIQEQNDQFGKKYSYTFNYEEMRKKVEDGAREAGYTFKYSIF